MATKTIAKKTATSAVAKTTAPKTTAPKTAKVPTPTTTTAPAPVARKTTKTTVATPLKKISKVKQRIALFIDVDNVGISRENLLEILFFVNGKYNVELCKLYGFSDETLPGIKEIAEDYNMTTVGKMKFKITGENCLDPRVLIDAYECAVKNSKYIDAIFVWCYPCDLASLFEKIIDLGVSTATIDNPAFDCKNKYVSQTFKIFSNYNFKVGETMYGQIQNNPAPYQPASEPTPIPTTIPTPAPAPSPEPKPEPTPEPVPEVKPEQPEPETKPNNTQKVVQPDLDTLDGKPIPVLPRREILERGSGNKPASQPSDDTNNQSVVDEISRKLNIRNLEAQDNTPNDLPPTDEPANTPEEASNDINEAASILDVIKRAGLLDDFNDGSKEKKYEDTIGDL